MPFLVPFAAAAIPALASGGTLAGAGSLGLSALTGGAALGSAAGITSLATAGLGTAGTLLSGLGALKSGSDASAAADANARMLDIQAGQTIAAGKVRASQEAIGNSRAISGARAEYGASGVDTSGGSPLMTLNENIRQSQAESMYTRLGANAEAYNLRQQADITRQRGKQAQGAGFLNAATGLLNTFGNSSLLSRTS